jgi:hypothetical protein
MQKLNRWLDQADDNPSDEAESVGSLYTYKTQPVVLTTKSLDMADDFMQRNPTGNGYTLRVEIPYLIVNGEPYDFQRSDHEESRRYSAIKEIHSLMWYNHLLSKLPISQKKGGSVSIKSDHMDIDFMDMGDGVLCLGSLLKMFFTHFDEIYAGSPMEGNGLDDEDIEPVDARHTQMSTDVDDIGDNTEETEEDYYNAYRGDAAADALLARNATDEDDQKRRMAAANKDTTVEDLKRWGY